MVTSASFTCPIAGTSTSEVLTEAGEHQQLTRRHGLLCDRDDRHRPRDLHNCDTRLVVHAENLQHARFAGRTECLDRCRASDERSGSYRNCLARDEHDHAGADRLVMFRCRPRS